MPATAPAFISALDAAASAAQRAEIEFRNHVAREIGRLERDRQFAYRRLAIAKSLAQSAAGAKTEADAIVAQQGALKRELGWHGESEKRKTTLAAFEPVARAVWGELAAAAPDGRAPSSPPAGPSVGVAMRAFEDWYAREHGASYLALLDHEMPEIPVVEF